MQTTKVRVGHCLKTEGGDLVMVTDRQVLRDPITARPNGLIKVSFDLAGRDTTTLWADEDIEVFNVAGELL